MWPYPILESIYMPQSLEISIILPAHNEAENLPSLLKKITTKAKDLRWDYEIIVVNDGSTDNTQEIIKRSRSSQVKLINHITNYGYGAALCSGFKLASKKWVFFTDADGQFDFNEIDKLLALMEKADIIAGFRANRHDPLIRRLNALIFNIAISILFQLKIKDIDCAFKLIKKEVLDKAHPKAAGALINTELLYKAKKMGYTIIQTPVNHYPRIHGKQSGANISVILRAIKELFLFRITGELKSSTQIIDSKILPIK